MKNIVNFVASRFKRVNDAFASETSVFRIGKNSPRITKNILPFDPYLYVADTVLPIAEIMKSKGRLTIETPELNGVTHVIRRIDGEVAALANMSYEIFKRMNVVPLEDMVFQLRLERDSEERSQTRIVMDILGKTSYKDESSLGPEAKEGYLPFEYGGMKKV